MRRASNFYLALVAVLDRRIRSLRLPMSRCDELSGNEMGYTAKALKPDTKTGRQMKWETLDRLLPVLYPNGFRLGIVPLEGEKPNPRALARRGNKTREYRRLAQYVLTPEKARECAKKRWSKVRKSERKKMMKRVRRKGLRRAKLEQRQSRAKLREMRRQHAAEFA